MHMQPLHLIPDVGNITYIYIYIQIVFLIPKVETN